MAYGSNFEEIVNATCLPDESYIFRVTGALDISSEDISWSSLKYQLKQK
jgi:hypothetical protein